MPDLSLGQADILTHLASMLSIKRFCLYSSTILEKFGEALYDDTISIFECEWAWHNLIMNNCNGFTLTFSTI